MDRSAEPLLGTCLAPASLPARTLFTSRSPTESNTPAGMPALPGHSAHGIDRAKHIPCSARFGSSGSRRAGARRSAAVHGRESRPYSGRCSLNTYRFCICSSIPSSEFQNASRAGALHVKGSTAARERSVAAGRGCWWRGHRGGRLFPAAARRWRAASSRCPMAIDPSFRRDRSRRSHC